jgi:predicted secreted hydrolase
MKVSQFTDSDGTPWLSLHLNQSQALMIVESLARQVRTGDPNTSRPEFKAHDGKRFLRVTIAVLESEDNG